MGWIGKVNKEGLLRLIQLIPVDGDGDGLSCGAGSKTQSGRCHGFFSPRRRFRASRNKRDTLQAIKDLFDSAPTEEQRPGESSGINPACFDAGQPTQTARPLRTPSR